MANKRIKDLETTITAFRTGDVIPVDGPSGTAKMGYNDLLQSTAENAEHFLFVSDKRVLNGNINRYKYGNSDITHVYQKGDDGSFLLRRTASGNTWSYYTNPFTPDYTKPIKISFKVETTENNTYTGVKIRVYVSSGGGTVSDNNQILITGSLSPNGTVSLEFDATKQPDFDWTNCNVWVSINGANGYVSEVRVSDLLVYQIENKIEYNNFNGDDLQQIFSSLDEKLNNKLLETEYVTNGTIDIAKKGNSDISGSYQKNDDGSFVLRRTSAGNNWSYYATPFTPKAGSKVYISFSFEKTENNTNDGVAVSVYVSSGSGSWATDQQVLIKGVIAPPNNVLVEFDPTEHPDWEHLNVWVAINGANDKISEIKVSNLLVYQKFNQDTFEHFSGDNLRQILKSADAAIIDGNIMDENKTNGKLLSIKEGNSDISGAYQKNDDGSFVLRRTSAGNNWSSYNTPFVPDFSSLVKITFKVETTENNTNPDVRGVVYVSNGRKTYAAGECKTIATYDPSMGEVSVTFDPSYYQIYMDPAWTQFNVWVTIVGATDLISEMKISDLKVYQLADEVLFSNFNGENARELFESIDEALAGVSTTDKSVLVSPDGTKFLLAVQNNGNVSTIPAIPSKCVYFGNSLLLGSGSYGLTASDDEHDYYHLINTYIQSNLNQSFAASRYSGVAFESITDPANVNSIVSSLLNNLDGDEDLVVVQLGDNVNTAAKLAVFENSARVLLQAIRTKCSNARVVWFGMWYGSSTKFDIVEDACRNTGCEFVSMVHINKSVGQSYIGAVQKKPLNDYTLSDVSAVEEVAGGYIHITFSVSGNEYTSEIPVNSWSLSGATLTYNGEYTIVTSSGVASHPGDIGMRDISNLFLFQLGYSSTPNPIP